MRSLMLSLSLLMLLNGCSLFESKVIFAGLSGHIIDKSTKLPIEGAVVFVHWQSELVGFEVAGGPPVYLDETVTDKSGFFRFPDSTPTTVKLSTRLRGDAPIVGIIKAGYKFYLMSLSHNETRRHGLNAFSPSKTDHLSLELSQTSYEESINYDGMTSIFLHELDSIFRSSRCVPGRLSGTIGQLDTIRRKVHRDDLNLYNLYGIVNSIISDSICHGVSR